MRLSPKLFKFRIEWHKIVSLAFSLAIMNYNQIHTMIIDMFYSTLELDIQMIIWA